VRIKYYYKAYRLQCRHTMKLEESKLRKHIERGKSQLNIFNTFLTKQNVYNKAVLNKYIL